MGKLDREKEGCGDELGVRPGALLVVHDGLAALCIINLAGDSILAATGQFRRGGCLAQIKT